MRDGRGGRAPGPDRPGAGAVVSQQADAHRHSVRARRRQRHRRAAARHEDERELRSAGDRRQQARCARCDRRGLRGEVGRRRTRDADGTERRDDRQSGDPYQAAVLDHARFRAGDDDRLVSADPGGQCVVAGEIDPGAGGVRQNAPGQDQLRLDHRAVPAHHRAVQPEDRLEVPAHPVQEQRRLCECAACRRDHDLLLRSAACDRSHQIGQAACAGGDRIDAASELARCADHGRGGRCRDGDPGVDGAVPAGRIIARGRDAHSRRDRAHPGAGRHARAHGRAWRRSVRHAR